MLILRVILAGVAVVALAVRPGTARGAMVALGAAGLDAALGAGVEPAIRIVAPMVVFLAAALTLAGTLERAGLAERIATSLARRAHGSSRALYTYVCFACAALTATVSLDGAVVLMVPILLALKRRYDAPFAPLFLGTVVVANASSIAVPQGNPTNLLIIERLGIAPTTFLAHMLAPGLIAAVLCAAAVAVSERRRLAVPYARSVPRREPLSRAERQAVRALVLVALAAWVAPLLGIAPWWPFSGAVALVLIAERRRPTAIVPWQIGVQIASTLIVVQALGVPALGRLGSTLPGLLLVATASGAAAALLNNLPVGASAVALITAAPVGYAASVGLAVGSLATPQGSVATLIASELAGADAPSLPLRRLAPLATVAVLAATVAVWTTL